MTPQQHLVRSSNIQSKYRYSIYILAISGGLGGLISFGMYQVFMNSYRILFPIDPVKFYTFLDSNIVPYVFMGFAIVTLINLGHFF